MKVVKSIETLKNIIKDYKEDENSIGLVPTMGALHDAHESLIRLAKHENDIVVVSVFVNPIQFCPGEDLDEYPKDRIVDIEVTEKNQVDVLFIPEISTIYPSDFKTLVSVSSLDNHLCGKLRPGHFNGVTTIVAKLLNLVSPDRAYFGEKDFQQLLIIRRMVSDLNIDVDIIAHPIVREEDGLAFSSRNRYLGKVERNAALSLFEAIKTAREMFDKGERRSEKIIKKAFSIINKKKCAKIEYIKVCDLIKLKDLKCIEDNALFALSVRFGNTRLIDNAVLEKKDVKDNVEIKDS